MPGRHVYFTNPACPAFIAEDLDHRFNAIGGAQRHAVAGRVRRSQSLAASRALRGLSRHLLRDIGIDLGAA
ncbi:MAG: hypothetical protein QNJ30_05525 [Kiloniellales bacterium]|nr:hypothetical protein [Kiloniellales bacterium]